MIITRTPYRLSFFGGGSDYPAWFEHHNGAVLGVTIDKYCWITVRQPPTFFGPRYKLIYNKTEDSRCIGEIEHPAIRETLAYMGYPERMEIYHTSDLPARSGVGSSSAFVVGLIKALATLDKNYWEGEGETWGAHEVAESAVWIEQGILKETVGCQDQYLCSYGGLNTIQFPKKGKPKVSSLGGAFCGLGALEQRLMLFWTKVQRTASDVASGYVDNLVQKFGVVKRMIDMVGTGRDIIERYIRTNDTRTLDDFGYLLDEAWCLKKMLGQGITTPEIDVLYNTAKNAGALGGKIGGAGGGGFLLLYVPPEKQDKVRCALTTLVEVPFKFEFEGCKVVYDGENRVAA